MLVSQEHRRATQTFENQNFSLGASRRAKGTLNNNKPMNEETLFHPFSLFVPAREVHLNPKFFPRLKFLPKM